jgi:hypothetical protein
MIRLTNPWDFWGGLILGMLGLLVMLGALQMPVGSLAQPEDGLLPVLVGSIIVLLSAWLIFKSLRRSRDSVKETFFWPDSGSPVRIACILIAMLVYLFIFEWMGFAPATFVLLVFLLRTIDPVPWKSTVLMSLLTTVLCVLLFQVWLKVQLPMGWLSGLRVGTWIF